MKKWLVRLILVTTVVITTRIISDSYLSGCIAGCIGCMIGDLTEEFL